MSSAACFIPLSILIAVAGLFAAAMAQDYMQFFGLCLFAFGLLFGLSTIKRHYDAQEAAKRGGGH